MNFYSYYPTSDDGSINRATSIENYYNKQQMITNSKKKTKKGGSGGSTTTGKHRGGGGVGVKLSTDPQSVAARERRHKISEKFKTLQSLLPGGRGSKLDTVSMLEQAIQYVKFLKDQISMHQDLMLTMNTTSSNNQHHYLDYHDAHAGIGGLILDHRPFFDEIPNPDDHDGGIISTDNSSSRQLLWSGCTSNANNVTVQDGLHRPSEVAVPLTDLVVNNESIDPACSSIVWPYQAAEPHYYDNSQWGTISWEHPGDCAWVNQGG